MPLDRESLKTDLVILFRNAETDAADGKDPIEELCDSLATAIDRYVRGAQVVVDNVNTNVTVVSVSGVTPGPGASGPGTGTGTGSGTGHLE